MKYIYPVLIFLVLSCNKSGNDKNKQDPQTVAVEDSLTNEDEAEDNQQSECKYKNGMHHATVEYYDPNKGESNSYKLEVEIAECEVIQIKFPDGEWLDKSNVTSKELNEEGEVYIEGKDGRNYNVVIDK